MKNFKRILVIATLLIAFAANAWAVVAVPIIVAAAALGAVLVVGGTVAYHKPTSTQYTGPQHVVSPTSAAIGRALFAVHKEFTKFGTEQLKGRLVTCKVYYSDLADRVLSNPSKYPNLLNAVNASVAADLNSFADVGTITNDNGQYRIVTASGVGSGPYAIPSGSSTFSWTSSDHSSAIVYYGFTQSSGGWDYYNSTRWFNLSPSAPPVPTKKTPQAFVSDNVFRDTNGNVKDVYKGEIDDFIASEPNVLHYVDTATPDDDLDSAPPFVPPVPVPSPTDSANPIVYGLGSSNVPRTQSAVEQARSNYESLSQAATQARAASNANPSDPVLLAAAEAAERDAAAAKAALDAATRAADNAKAASEEEYPNPSVDERKRFDWSSFNRLKGAMEGVFPFSLLALLPQLFSMFVREPAAPVFDLPVFGHTMHVDLAIFDPVALVVRWSFAVLATVGGIYFLANWYRGR